MPSADSEVCSAPGPKVGAGQSPSSTGSSISAAWTVMVTGAGGAIVFGQSVPATLTRSTCPGDHS